MEPAKSPSHKDAPKIKYDVFVSFRGEDIRDGFLSHLIPAFHRKKIDAFVDDKLKRGHEIWPALVEAIEGSSISVIIFSKNYASSRWCLKELVKIHECREKYGQDVIPVFYHVDPTDVRHQTKSYKTAFAKLAKRNDPTMVQNWRVALRKSANLSGAKSSNSSNDAKLLEEIVNLVLKRLSKPLICLEGLIGIDKKIAHVESMIRQESKDARIIGIWGMGGIGKTTIAQEVYNKLHYEYEGCCFLANEREESKRNGIFSLKEKIFSALLGEDVKIDTYGLPDYIKRRIGRMKVLVVVDDVNDLDHPKMIFGTLDYFGPGSRIIVTTRYKKVLMANKVHDIYPVEELSSNEALQLFILNAFNLGHVEKDYYELSKRVVDYAGGIPMVLIVLGRLLCGEDNKEVWKSQLSKLEKIPDKKIYDVLKLSYDDLDRKEQNVFLDIACFFRVLNLEVGDLEALLKDGASDNSVAVMLERLKDRALIKFSKDNVIPMHDIIKEMAWEIVRQESNEDIGRYSRLWNQDDIYDVLKNEKGTECIRSMVISSSIFRDRKFKLSPYVFAKMHNLQFLHLEDPHTRGLFYEYHDILPEGLQYLPNEIRYLHWENYPLRSLPEKFSAEKLVMLDLTDSIVQKLWNGVQNLSNLKKVKLSECQYLKELPDFSKATNLEVLDVSYCSCLSNMHPSIFSLDKLVKLNLQFCASLAELTSDTHFRSLSYLNLFHCTNLRKFSVTSENMIELNLGKTKVKELPSNFGHQGKLEMLHLGDSDIERLPSCMINLTRLRYLDVNECGQLRTIPNLPPSLETLLTYNCESLETVSFPSMVAEQLKENRKRVELWDCFGLDEQSLIAIELNARINVVKFAQKHLSAASKHDYVENYDDYDHKFRSYQAVYVYPGSSVPEWLEYKTTEEDYIIIDLSSATTSSTPLGFIFCFVFCSPYMGVTAGLDITITISNINGEEESGRFHMFSSEDEKESVRIFILRSDTCLSSDHVCLVYDQRCSRYLCSRLKSQTRFKIKVPEMAPHCMVLSGFGVCLVSEFHSVNRIARL